MGVRFVSEFVPRKLPTDVRVLLSCQSHGRSRHSEPITRQQLMSHAASDNQTLDIRYTGVSAAMCLQGARFDCWLRRQWHWLTSIPPAVAAVYGSTPIEAPASALRRVKHSVGTS